MIHGIKLRGRIHPEDVLLILEQAQFEQHPVVRRMIIHVLGQISYKKKLLAQGSVGTELLEKQVAGRKSQTRDDRGTQKLFRA